MAIVQTSCFHGFYGCTDKQRATTMPTPSKTTDRVASSMHVAFVMEDGFELLRMHQSKCMQLPHSHFSTTDRVCSPPGFSSLVRLRSLGMLPRAMRANCSMPKLLGGSVEISLNWTNTRSDGSWAGDLLLEVNAPDGRRHLCWHWWLDIDLMLARQLPGQASGTCPIPAGVTWWTSPA